MLFSSLTFLFIFLPLFLICYECVRPKYKNLVLLIASWIFYAWGEIQYLWILLLSTLVDYSVGRCLKQTEIKWQRNALLCVSLIVNFSLLFYFKYSSFIADLLHISIPVSHHLPIGISFYTFQTLSYTIDVYRKKVKPLDHFIDFATYVTMFMQLIAGPIVRFSDVEKEITHRTVTKENRISGIKRFVLGLSKKVLLANQMGLLWENISQATIFYGLDGWIGIIAFALQIYFDFSGYSDMAIGLGQMLGFSFPENFNDPYWAVSITEFWRRWHMTLGTWFREYLYIPLGGNKTTFWRWTRNLLFIWAFTGLWHGASLNFVLWGLYYGLLLWMEKVFFKPKTTHWYHHLTTLFCVLIGWVLFAFEDLGTIVIYLKGMFNFSTLISKTVLYQLQSNLGLLVISISLCHPWVMKKWMKSNHWVCLCLFILCICYLIDGSYNPFLYFRF